MNVDKLLIVKDLGRFGAVFIEDLNSSNCEPDPDGGD